MLLRGIWLALSLATGAAHAELALGIVATRDAADVAADWQPIVDDMAKRVGQPARLVVCKDEAELLQRLARNEVQLARSSTRLALDSVEAGHAEIFARLALNGGGAEYRSLLLARR